MKIIRSTTLLILLCALLPQTARGVDNFKKVGTTAAQFLKIDAGARGIAMGGCFASLANDASALYWNPAGISSLDQMEVTLTHTEWFADISHNYAGVVFPMKSDYHAFGVSMVFQNMGDIEQTTIEEPQGTGIEFDAQDYALGLTYARTLTDFIRVGVTAKYINQRIWNESASTFAFDVGMLLDTGIKNIKVAMVMTNWGGDMKLDGRDLLIAHDPNENSISNPGVEAKLAAESWPLPTNFRLSISSNLLGPDGSLAKSQSSRFTFITDITHPSDWVEQINMGAEYSLKERLFLRGGYRTRSDEEGLSFGAGVIVPVQNYKIVLDYAYADFGVFSNVQHFTLGIRF